MMRGAAIKIATWLWGDEANGPYGPPDPERSLRDWMAWHLYHWGIRS